jgi:hypothetical protein
MIFCIAINKNHIYKREYLSIYQKTACLMAGGFLATDICVHVPAHTGTWLL